MTKNPTLNGTASMVRRVTRGTVAAQYIDHAEQANGSVKPVIAITTVSEPVFDHSGQRISEVYFEVHRHVRKDRSFAAPIVLPALRPGRRSNFHAEMAVDFSWIGLGDDYPRLFQEPLQWTVERPQA